MGVLKQKRNDGCAKCCRSVRIVVQLARCYVRSRDLIVMYVADNAYTCVYVFDAENGTRLRLGHEQIQAGTDDVIKRQPIGSPSASHKQQRQRRRHR